jgi:hypothetical protein
VGWRYKWISLGTSGDGNDEIISNFFNKSLLEEITLFENIRICKNKGNSVDKRTCKEVGSVK